MVLQSYRFARSSRCGCLNLGKLIVGRVRPVRWRPTALTRVELGIVLVFATAARGLVLALELSQRRRFFVIAHVTTRRSGMA
jgi:hypothetical protein